MIHVGDALTVLRTMAPESVHCVVSSPPYWGLRDYGIAGQLGLEATPEEYVARMVEVFREVRRVLRADGTLWCNLGDSYAANGPRGNNNGSGATGLMRDGRAEESRLRSASKTKTLGMSLPAVDHGLKPKDLVGIPWRVAFALQADGWYLRSDIVWHKPNPMPESVTDRPTKSHEYVFLLSKSPRYFYDAEAIKEDGAWCGLQLGIVRGKKVRAEAMGRKPSGNEIPGADATSPDRRNARSVWTIATQPYTGAHFATFPEELARRCIMAGTSQRGCCPECGAPWRRVVERHRNGHDWNQNNRNGGDRLAVGQSASDRAPDDYQPPTTTGWASTCAHAAEPVPCTVLDPFAGAGTVGVESVKLGREYVLIELKPEYADMARARIRAEAPLFAGAAP
jgi:DNA modification methylase